MRLELDYRQLEIRGSQAVEDQASELEVEIARLQKLVAELLIRNQQLREAVSLHRDDAWARDHKR